MLGNPLTPSCEASAKSSLNNCSPIGSSASFITFSPSSPILLTISIKTDFSAIF